MNTVKTAIAGAIAAAYIALSPQLLAEDPAKKATYISRTRFPYFLEELNGDDMAPGSKILAKGCYKGGRAFLEEHSDFYQLGKDTQHEILIRITHECIEALKSSALEAKITQDSMTFTGRTQFVDTTVDDTTYAARAVPFHVDLTPKEHKIVRKAARKTLETIK